MSEIRNPKLIMSETFDKIKKDFHAALSMDPAATSKVEVVLTYAGFHALLSYRLAHWLWKRRIPFVPRSHTSGDAPASDCIRGRTAGMSK